MKLRIVSGNQTGAVVDLPFPEARAALDTGYAVPYEEPVAPAPVVEEKEKPHKVKGK